ncbi:MAG: glycosyltransferase family 4 protein [Acidimicrobiia bacterium]|nr:glycosyltransferase family 4 protein [Acidimicrobiia bacterium]
MRIAQIAPPWFTVPPRHYGGIELVVALLADGLEARGHEVTLFASGGSDTKATLVSPLEEVPDPALLGNSWFDAFHALSAYLDVGRFDVVHDHSGIIGPSLAAMLGGTPPVVHTLHGPWTESSRRFYSLIDERVHLVAISDTQRCDNPTIKYAATVHNGIDLELYPYRAEKEDFLVYVGRANPDKGPTRAIEVARRAGLPLAMIVKKTEPFERAYWEEIVAPMLTDDVEVFEAVSHEFKVDLLGRARAMVFPIDWAEPFGLVMIEAMACGTPVVTCPVGAASEVVTDGVTGFLAESLDELAAAVGRVEQCAPEACRADVEARFSADLMVDAYEGLLTGLALPSPA